MDGPWPAETADYRRWSPTSLRARPLHHRFCSPLRPRSPLWVLAPKPNTSFHGGPAQCLDSRFGKTSKSAAVVRSRHLRRGPSWIVEAQGWAASFLTQVPYWTWLVQTKSPFATEGIAVISTLLSFSHWIIWIAVFLYLQIFKYSSITCC
jgi:hypothetical protein